MTKIKFALTNVRLIKKLEAEMVSGHLYYIKGGNQKGKTTTINAITSLLDGNLGKNMLTSGEVSGEISGTIIGADDKPYNVTINLKNEKSPSFTIINPDMSKSTRKGDLKDIFGYNTVTVETFMGWGLTEPGRRNQAEMFMKLLPQEVQIELNGIELDINSRDGILYTERTTTGQQINLMKDMNVAPSEKEIEIAGKLPQWTEQIKKMEEYYQANAVMLSNYEASVNIHKEKTASVTNNITHLEERIKDLQLQLQTQQELLKQLNDNPVAPIQVTKETQEEYQSKLSNARAAITTATLAEDKVKKYNESKANLQKKEARYKELTDTIEQKKRTKAALVKTHLNIPNVSIEDGELMYQDETGKYPVTEESISYSRGAAIVLDLLKRLNPNYPILCLGKSSEFDLATQHKFAELAEKENAIVILDYVTENPSQDLIIECFEQTLS
jgi:hypothetical protein